MALASKWNIVRMIYIKHSLPTHLKIFEEIKKLSYRRLSFTWVLFYLIFLSCISWLIVKINCRFEMMMMVRYPNLFLNFYLWFINTEEYKSPVIDVVFKLIVRSFIVTVPILANKKKKLRNVKKLHAVHEIRPRGVKIYSLNLVSTLTYAYCVNRKHYPSWLTNNDQFTNIGLDLILGRWNFASSFLVNVRKHLLKFTNVK